MSTNRNFGLLIIILNLLLWCLLCTVDSFRDLTGVLNILLIGFTLSIVLAMVNVQVCAQMGDTTTLAGLSMGTLISGILLENPMQGFAYA